MKNLEKTAVAVARVSSKEQEAGFSLDSQEKLAREYAERQGFRIVKVYRISESASGKQVRKIYNEMFRYVVDKKTQVILYEKIDRLTRNLKDAAVVQDWVNEDTEREVHFIKENFTLNRNTRAHENLVWDMKVAIARFYTNNLSEEVRKGLNEKLSQGIYPGRPPLGYKLIGEKGHRTYVIDQDKAPFVQKMFALYNSGNYSIGALADLLYKQGLRNRGGGRIGKTRMHMHLSDPFYYGFMKWKSMIQKGNHEPIITKELFDQVQRKLDRGSGSPQYQKHLNVFKAKMKCGGCGGTIGWSLQKERWYGECNHHKDCKQKGSIRQDRLEEKLFPLFDKIEPKNARVLEVLELALKESHKDEIEFNVTRREELNRIIRRADERMERAYRDKLDGLMPLDLCEKIIAGTKQEKEDAISALENLSKSRQAYYEVGMSIHELATKAKDIYLSKKATIEDKRMLLSYAFSNFTLNAGEIKAEYSLAFQFLTEWTPRLNNNFELQKSLVKQEDFGELVASCSDLRRGRDSNPRRVLKPLPR